jgi:plastocyanin
MFAPALDASYHTPNTKGGSVASRLLKQVNMGSLAFAMFVALAILSNTQGEDARPGRSSAPRAANTEVAINNFGFSPETIAVPVGATVTWINHDNVPHVVTSANNRFNKSPVLKAGQTFSNTFVTAGTYSYFCSIHPRMTGKITVR